MTAKLQKDEINKLRKKKNVSRCDEKRNMLISGVCYTFMSSSGFIIIIITFLVPLHKAQLKAGELAARE